MHSRGVSVGEAGSTAYYNCSGENASVEKGVNPAIQNSSEEKPIEPPGEQRYRLRPRKGKRYSRRFLRKLISGAPYTVSTIQKSSNEVIQTNIRDYNKLLRQSAPEPTTIDQKNNLNLGKNGVEPIALKVYE